MTIPTEQTELRSLLSGIRGYRRGVARHPLAAGAGHPHLGRHTQAPDPRGLRLARRVGAAGGCRGAGRRLDAPRTGVLQTVAAPRMGSLRLIRPAGHQHTRQP